jgi:hypothetical protein
MLNLVINDMPAHFGDFKPTHVTDCFTGSIYRVVYCVFDAFGGGTDQLDLFVDVVTHKHILVARGLPKQNLLAKKLPKYWFILRGKYSSTESAIRDGAYPQAKS